MLVAQLCLTLCDPHGLYLSICRNSYVRCIYIYSYYITLLDWSLDHYVTSFFYFLLQSLFIMSSVSITIPAFYFCDVFFQSVTFSLHVSLNLKWISCRQHVYKPCFSIQIATFGLLIGAFSPFTFQVIIDKYNRWDHERVRHNLATTQKQQQSIYCHFLHCFGVVFVVLFCSFLLLLSSLVIWWLSLLLCLDSFLFTVCVCITIINFWYGYHEVYM